MKRILIKRRASLGDVLNTTPVARRLRTENPKAIIRVSTHHGAAYVGNKDISDTEFGIDETAFHQIIDLNMCFESNRRIHQVDANMLKAFGDTEGDKTIKLAYGQLNAAWPWDKVVVIHANRTWAQRTIERQFWEKTISLLEERGLVPVLTGTSQDWPIDHLHNLRDRLTLPMQAALINQAACFLTGASGLVTVAGATETPMVVLTSMTPALNWFPYRRGTVGWNMFEVAAPVPCHGCDVNEPPSEYYPCRRTDIPNECMSSFSPKIVADRVEQAIAEDRRK